MWERLRHNRLLQQINQWQKGVLDSYYWQQTRKEYLATVGASKRVEDVVEQVWNFKGEGFYKRLRPIQDRYELTTLATRVRAIDPQVVVEIGTHYGGTLFVWSQSMPRLELLVSIDLPGGIHGGGYPDQRGRLYKLFNTHNPQCRIELIRADSHQAATCQKLVELLDGRPIDFLFVDGDHRYAGVKTDFELYAPLVRPGGLIAFHDIRPNKSDPSIEVYRLWEDIKANGNQGGSHVEEIVHEPYSGRYGIGLLSKG